MHIQIADHVVLLKQAAFPQRTLQMIERGVLLREMFRVAACDPGSFVAADRLA